MDIQAHIKDYTIFKDALNLITNGVLITNTMGIILYVNQSFCNMCKYTKEELLGQNPRILKSGAHNEKFYEKMWKTIANGQIWRNTIINKDKEGNLYTDSIMITPIVRNGQTLYFVCTRYNIDQLEDKIDKLDQISSRMANLQSDFELNE